MIRKCLLCFLFVMAWTGVCLAQLVGVDDAPTANCCLQFQAQRVADELKDRNQLGRYHRENERLMKEPAVSGRVVFLGDSITEGWDLAAYFPGKPYVNRGISGQTTAQMLVRLFPDVIHLQPAVMVLLGGTNDLAQTTGPVTAGMVQDNLKAMTELARLHGIRVILCSIMPVNDYTEGRQTPRRPPKEILRLNRWLKEYAEESGAYYLDYFQALADERGMLKKEYSDDGLHPNAAGYRRIAPLAEDAIQQVLRNYK